MGRSNLASPKWPDHPEGATLGNYTLPDFPKDEIPGSGILHSKGLLLGGGLRLGKAEINTLPSTIRDGLPPQISSSVFGQINDADTSGPSDRYLGFDPGGSPEWGAFLRHPWDALKAKELGKQAMALTQKLYPDGPSNPGLRHNDAADAFRHAYWSYTMAKAFGPAEAQLFGNAHEVSAVNPAGERYMDLYNNQIGRNMAEGGQGKPVDIMRNAVGKGLTRNSPFR
jgi:hypothetical protein